MIGVRSCAALNTIMRIDEFTNPLKRFLVQVRARGTMIRTTVEADNRTQACAMLAHLYGLENIVSVTQAQSITNEAGTFKPKSPEQLRIKSMDDQAANLKQQAKREKAQQLMAKAQERLRKANFPAKPDSARS